MRRDEGRARRSRRGNTAARAVGAAAMVLVVVLSTGTALAVFYFHLAIRPVLSGSMRPTYAPGWAIVTRPVPVSEVRSGQIVVIEPPGSNVQYAHRVVSVSGPSDRPVIITKGDANRAPDAWRARLNGGSVPEVVAEVPAIGWVMVDVRNQWAHAALIAVVGLGICVAGTWTILGDSRTTTRRRTAMPSPRAQIAGTANNNQ